MLLLSANERAIVVERCEKRLPELGMTGKALSEQISISESRVKLSA
jgi:hypothetical protein